MRAAVDDLQLEARIGIEAGEVVVDGAESTFATGEAVNLAARLQEAARPGEILVGPTAYRLAAGSLVVEDAGPLELKGIDGPLRAWRVVDMLDGPGRPLGPRAPLVGRDDELELLENTFKRSLRDSRAHLFTIYGEAGVGKSRLAREFLDGVERASVLMGRALPYGEGVTYWPLGEMVKAAAGISDDDPLEEAFEKLRECCAEEAVADVLGLAAGLMEALEGERSPQEIAWAAREVMQGIADVQPLILLFEDIHWAEAPLLDLIEHVADWVRAPLLILCLARPELLDARPGWGGGRVRSTAIELEPLSEEESAELVEQLLSQLAGAPASGRRRCRRRRSIAPRATRSSSRRRSACSSRAGPATARRSRAGHAPGAHRRAHRPPRSGREDAAPARVGRRARVLAGRARAPVAGRRGPRGAARRPPPARVPPARAALVDLR